MTVPGRDRGLADLSESARRRSEWTVTKPRIVVAVLAAVGLIVRHGWISTRPLASGDWHWPGRGRIVHWFPWPSIWDPTLGLSGENRFLDVFRFPIFAIDGLIGVLGGSWTVIEKVVYYLPCAILLPIAGWLLAREILGSTRWALLAPVIMLGNTYLLIEANGEVPIVVGEAIGCIALVAFIRAMRGRSLRWAIVSGLLVGVTTAFDIRPAFITVLLMAGYLFVLVIAEPRWRLIGSRIFIGAAAGAAFIGSQAFWIIPFLTYHGHRSLPTPQAPDFNIITLAHGIAGVAAGWTGGTPAALVQAPLNPIFMVLPLIAMVPLLRRRMQPELIWLALAAVFCAFLAKTNTPPFGGVYDWIYLNIPGFKLFREGSKFYYPIALAYAVLIPAALRSMVQQAKELERTDRPGRADRATRRRARAIWAAASVGLALVLLITGSTLLVLERGQLGSTTTPAPEPRAFSEINAMLNADHQPGSVLWFGSPIFATNNKEHRYVLGSPTHALTNLTGNGTSTLINRRDVFQYFCPTPTEAFCYVNPSVFPYLVRSVGASYLVSPASSDAGRLPGSLTRSWLRQQLQAMFGSPIEVGDAPTQFFVWHIPTPQPAIATYPAVALVDSGPWSLSSVLPALQAMDVPAAYRQTFNKSDFRAAPANLPDSVSVVPRIDGGCLSTAPRQVGIMAQTTAATIDVDVGGSARTLDLLARSSRTPGWGVYGPVGIPSGVVPITTSSGGVNLGPCVAWSALAATAFGPHGQVVGPVRISQQGEQLRAPLTGATPAWTELRRLYDPGWRFNGTKPTAVADGLFSLYHTTKQLTSRRGFVFTFSTLKWERIGQALTFLAILGALLLLWRQSRAEKKRVATPRIEPVLEGRFAPLVGVLGFLFLGLTALATVFAWFGVASIAPWTAITSDPYGLDIIFGTMALALLGVSLFVRLGEHLLHRPPVSPPDPDLEPAASGLLATAGGNPAEREFALTHRHGKRRARRLALATAMCVLAACTGSAGNANRALSNAEQSGQLSGPPVGGPLDEAPIQQQAKNRRACVADYTIALKSFPGLVKAYSGRAACYRSGDLNAPASIHDLDRALSLSPDNPALLLQLAAAHRGVGDLGAAAENYQAAAVAPSSSDGQVLAAIDGLIGIGRKAAASTILRIAMQRYPRSALTALAAAALAAANGNDAQAQAALAAASHMALSKGEMVLVLSITCHYQVIHHDYQTAVSTCQSTVAMSPDGSGAYDDLGAAQAALGQLDQAIVDLTSAIGSFTGSVGPYAQPAGVDGFGLANLFEARGRLYVERHETALAITDYNGALATLPPGAPDTAARLRADIASAKTD